MYRTFRSVSDVHVFVLCYDESVPGDVRKQDDGEVRARSA